MEGEGSLRARRNNFNRSFPLPQPSSVACHEYWHRYSGILCKAIFGGRIETVFLTPPIKPFHHCQQHGHCKACDAACSLSLPQITASRRGPRRNSRSRTAHPGPSAAAATAPCSAVVPSGAAALTSTRGWASSASSSAGRPWQTAAWRAGPAGPVALPTATRRGGQTPCLGGNRASENLDLEDVGGLGRNGGIRHLAASGKRRGETFEIFGSIFGGL